MSEMDSPPPVTPLLTDITPQQLAHSCRQAGLSFLHGALKGFGPRGLDDWLDGPYRATLRQPRVTPLPRTQRLAGLAGALVRLVRTAVVDNVRGMAGGDWGPVVDAMRVGAILPARTPAGELVWTPVDDAQLRLDHRVRALFVCDYLVDADAYEQLLNICVACYHMDFDGSGRACTRCVPESRVSVVRSRGVFGANVPAKKAVR